MDEEEISSRDVGREAYEAGMYELYGQPFVVESSLDYLMQIHTYEDDCTAGSQPTRQVNGVQRPREFENVVGGLEDQTVPNIYRKPGFIPPQFQRHEDQVEMARMMGLERLVAMGREQRES